MNPFYEEYKRKLRTPEEAVSVVKNGDWVDFTTATSQPFILDEALAKRRDELLDVKIRGNLLPGPILTAECDPTHEHFTYNSWHCSAYERKLCDKGLCFYSPMIFHNLSAYYHYFIDVDVAMVSLPPMDKHGYFSFSLNVGATAEILRQAKTVIVEVNENLPYVRGGYDDCIHISDVDYIVEGPHKPFPHGAKHEPTASEKRISEMILPYIVNGATIQLGIGTMSEAIGEMLSQTDLKDLGMHTELCGDAYLSLYRAGKLTNRAKKINRGKGVFAFAIGSPELYEWIDSNPSLKGYPIEYVNRPDIIGQIDNMVSINSCLSIDLYGQVSAESVGLRQISGTGGQLDFLEGASLSNGGKCFLCMNSTYTDKKGVLHSRVVPHFNGEIITSPRSQVYFIATEYGVINLEGLTTWERAEKIISIAHPAFRDQLTRAAIEQRIWRKRSF